jgi:putative solute:sodium symporter small subunit
MVQEKTPLITGGCPMDEKAAQRERHWANTKTLTIVTLILWFVFGILTPWFAKELDEFTFLGFKLGYYMVVQGSLIAFVLLIIIPNIIQDRIDAKYGSGER